MLLCLLLPLCCCAQTPLTKPDLGQPTLIAPAFFGPNAFAVPDMADGTVTGHLRVELAADGHFGYADDKTADLFARVHVPLFTDRANITIWMPVSEWYVNSLERQRQCRLQDTAVMRGQEFGDVYVSTDILVVRERRYVPAVTLRACLRTASGGSYHEARFYDGPGYFFDVAVGKEWGVKSREPRTESREWQKWRFRVAGTAGFLCWQTDNGRQNDAVMYGVKVAAWCPYLLLQVLWSGYTGWETAGDCPMALRTKVQGKIPLRGDAGSVQPFIEYQYGLRDQPWHSARLGVAYSFDAMGRAAKRQVNRTK